MSFSKNILIFAVTLLALSSDAFHMNRAVFKARRDVLWSSSETVQSETKVPQVFIGNLPFEVDESALKDLVADKVGPSLKSVFIARDKRTGRSRGFGYLNFEQKEQVESAVVALAGLQIAGRDLKVDLSSERPTLSRTREAPEHSAYIGNLDYTVTKEQIMEMCEDLLGSGVVQGVRLMTDRETGRSRGFGYIDFGNPEDVSKAIVELNGVSMVGRDIRVDTAQRKEAGLEKKEPRSKPAAGAGAGGNSAAGKHSIFLGNLAWDVTEGMLEDMLTDVVGEGCFVNIRLATDRETGKPRGFAHVDFRDAETAERSIVELNGMEVLGRQLRVDAAQR